MTKAFNDTRKRLLSYSLNETLLSCRIDGEACDADDFEWVYNDFHGNCHVFNSGQGGRRALRRISESGKPHGLHLELYVGMVPELEAYSVSGFAGAKIYINNNSFKSLYEDQLEVLVSSGSYTNVAVQRMIVKQLEKPYSLCTLRSDAMFYKKFKSLNFRKWVHMTNE